MFLPCDALKNGSGLASVFACTKGECLSALRVLRCLVLAHIHGQGHSWLDGDIAGPN